MYGDACHQDMTSGKGGALVLSRCLKHGVFHWNAAAGYVSALQSLARSDGRACAQLKNPLMRILEKTVNKPQQLFRCKSLFKPSCSSGIMQSFLGKRRERSIAPKVEYKKVEPKKKKVQKTLKTMFGCI